MSATALAEVNPAERVRIIDALYRFGAGQDLRDRNLFESAFTQDSILDFTGPAARFGVSIPVFRGRTSIADIVFSNIEGLLTTHTVTNPRITACDGETAKLFALVEAQHVLRSDPERHFLLKNIYYLDLSREGDGWRSSVMEIANVWFDGDPSLLFPSDG